MPSISPLGRGCGFTETQVCSAAGLGALESSGGVEVALCVCREPSAAAAQPLQGQPAWDALHGSPGALRQSLQEDPRGSELLGGAAAWLQWQLCAARGLCSTALLAPTPRLLLRLALFLWLGCCVLPAPDPATEG